MGAKRKRMQTSTHIWRQDDNCACAIFLENLAKNVLAFNFRKLEALEEKNEGNGIKESKTACKFLLENKMLDYSVHW